MAPAQTLQVLLELSVRVHTHRPLAFCLLFSHRRLTTIFHPVLVYSFCISKRQPVCHYSEDTPPDRPPSRTSCTGDSTTGLPPGPLVGRERARDDKCDEQKSDSHQGQRVGAADGASGELASSPLPLKRYDKVGCLCSTWVFRRSDVFYGAVPQPLHLTPPFPPIYRYHQRGASALSPAPSCMSR